MLAALTQFEEKRTRLSLNLCRRILGLRMDEGYKLNTIPVERPMGSKNLNSSQERAILTASQNSFTLIQGPPGTGKTETAAGLAYQLCTQYGTPILVCAASNNAVDLLADRISKLGLGSPTTVLETDALTQKP